MGFLFVLVGCGGPCSEDSGTTRDTGEACVETRTEVGLDVDVGLGFTGRDVADQITHTTTAELVWEEGPSSEVTPGDRLRRVLQGPGAGSTGPAGGGLGGAWG